MTAPLATLAFLAILWMLVVVAAAMFEGSGARILAALKRNTSEPVLRAGSVRLRQRRIPFQRPAPISFRQRAAA